MGLGSVRQLLRVIYCDSIHIPEQKENRINRIINSASLSPFRPLLSPFFRRRRSSPLRAHSSSLYRYILPPATLSIPSIPSRFPKKRKREDVCPLRGFSRAWALGAVLGSWVCSGWWGEFFGGVVFLWDLKSEIFKWYLAMNLDFLCCCWWSWLNS